MNRVWILALLALLASAAGALGQSSDGSDGSTCSSDSDCDSSSVCTVFEGLATGTCTQKGQLMSRCDDAAPCVSTDFLQLQCLQGFCLPSEDSGTPSQTIPAGGTCAVISNTQTCVENYFCNPLSLKCESATVASCTPNGNECAAGQICVPISTDQGGDGTTGSCITIGGSDQCSPECGDQEQCIGGRCVGIGNGTPGELNGPCLEDNTCTNSLAVCVSGVCSLPEDTNVGQPGEIAGPCVDGACNGENRCISNFCLPPEGSGGIGGSPGELGGPCLSDNTCSTSSRTTCLAGFCVPQDVVGPITPGDIGGACLEDGSCNSGATCNANNVCEAGSGGLAPGSLGGVCLEDGSCNTGLECAFDGTCAQAVDGGGSTGGDSGSGSDGPCQCLCNGIPIAGFKYNIACATCATQCRASLFSFCTTLGFGVVNLEGTNRGIVGDRCDPTTEPGPGPDPTPAPGELGGSCLAGDACNGNAVCGPNKICVPQSGNVDTSTGGTGAPATCTSTNPCPAGQRCNADSVCVALSAAGAACAATPECQTGLFCIDSVCQSTTGGGTTPPPANTGAAPGAAAVSEPVLAVLAFTAAVALLRV